MILGYEISANDNDEYFIEDWDNVPEYLKYKNTYEYSGFPRTLKFKKRKLDIGYTYDGFCIVSEKFKNLCQQEKFTGLEFIEVPSDKSFYQFKCHNTVAFDYVRRGTTFSKYNEQFEGYKEVGGATPIFLLHNRSVPENNIYRTDIFFGDSFKKSPNLMVGIQTKEIIFKWNLNGIYFNAILDDYPRKQKK